MRFYLDTEFNGHGGGLVSLALVSQWVDDYRQPPGHKKDFRWYAARRLSAQPVPWVAENVMPVLRTHILSDQVFRYEFQQFIERFLIPEIVCDWHMDAVHFCGLLQGEDYASSLDFPCTIRILKTPEGQPISAVPHNALEDAIALRDWHDSILAAA